jgi:hypothetical protein
MHLLRLCYGDSEVSGLWSGENMATATLHFAILTSSSLIDRTTQYFLAGATRQGKEHTDDLSLDRSWFGRSNIPTPGGLCEVSTNTCLSRRPFCDINVEYPCN